MPARSSLCAKSGLIGAWPYKIFEKVSLAKPSRQAISVMFMPKQESRLQAEFRLDEEGYAYPFGCALRLSYLAMKSREGGSEQQF